MIYTKKGVRRSNWSGKIDGKDESTVAESSRLPDMMVSDSGREADDHLSHNIDGLSLLLSATTTDESQE